MKKIIEQIEAMGLGEDKALAEAIDSADSVEKLISVLRERGIEATAEQLTGLKEGGEDGELTEEALENVGGGWFGFFGGYADGMSGVSAKYKNPIYGLGYKCGSLIGGHSRSW